MLANNLNNILEDFDFTDSIATEVKWSKHLVDLEVVVDYYWDIQDGRDETRFIEAYFQELCES